MMTLSAMLVGGIAWAILGAWGSVVGRRADMKIGIERPVFYIWMVAAGPFNLVAAALWWLVFG